MNLLEWWRKDRKQLREINLRIELKSYGVCGTCGDPLSIKQGWGWQADEWEPCQRCHGQDIARRRAVREARVAAIKAELFADSKPLIHGGTGASGQTEQSPPKEVEVSAEAR